GEVRDRETGASEPLMNCRKRRNDVKTRGLSLLWEKSEGRLHTVQTTSGIEVAWPWLRLLGGAWEPAFRCKGRSSSGRPARARVPMREAGTESRVVVRKIR